MESSQKDNFLIKIFIVDDHHVFRDGLRAILENEPSLQVVAEAANGDQIITKLEQEKVDLVLLDIDMPQVNGLEVMEVIKRSYPDLNVLVFSMHDNEAYIHKMLSDGAKGYLLKSCKKEELLRAIFTVSNGDTYLSSEVSGKLMNYISNRDNTKSKADLLTSRELQVLKLVATGLTNQQIGKKLFISHRTVDTHRQNIMEKLNLHSAVALTNYVIKNNL